MNPFFHTDFNISDSLKTVRKSVLIYETIIEIAIIENAGHEVNTDNPTLLGQKLNVFFKQYVW